MILLWRRPQPRNNYVPPQSLKRPLIERPFALVVCPQLFLKHVLDEPARTIEEISCFNLAGLTLFSKTAVSQVCEPTSLTPHIQIDGTGILQSVSQVADVRFAELEIDAPAPNHMLEIRFQNETSNGSGGSGTQPQEPPSTLKMRFEEVHQQLLLHFRGHPIDPILQRSEDGELVAQAATSLAAHIESAMGMGCRLVADEIVLDGPGVMVKPLAGRIHLVITPELHETIRPEELHHRKNA